MPRLDSIRSGCGLAPNVRTRAHRLIPSYKSYASSSSATASSSTSTASSVPRAAINTAESSSSTSVYCSSSTFNVSLPPIRSHLFREPLPYNIGLKLQNDLVQRRIDWKRDKGGGKTDLILFLEHTPTYTTGRRDNSPNPNTLHPEERKVQHVGAEFHITKRGGQVTYHGPGQLVGYPLFDLNAMEMPSRCYVDYLQRLLADHVRSKGIGDVLAPHPDGHVGIFASRTEKIASIGIHLQHRITSHGFAMNITPEPLAWFDLVLACGLADVRAVSLQDLMVRSAVANGVLPPPVPNVGQVAKELTARFEDVFKRPVLDLNDTVSLHLDGGAESELHEIRELVLTAERDARRVNEETGGWSIAPDLSRRVQGS